MYTFLLIIYLFSDESQCFQTIDFDSVLCLSLKMTILSYTNCLLLVCGLSNNKIQLYTNDFSNDNSVFIASHSLIGHEDWVRSLDFVTEGKYYLCINDHVINSVSYSLKATKA